MPLKSRPITLLDPLHSHRPYTSFDNFFCANPVTLLLAAACDWENRFDPNSILGQAGQAYQATQY